MQYIVTMSETVRLFIVEPASQIVDQPIIGSSFCIRCAVGLINVLQWPTVASYTNTINPMLI